MAFAAWPLPELPVDDIKSSDPTRLKDFRLMAPPRFQPDPITGLITVIEIATGKPKQIYPVDAREQLAVAEPKIRLASEEEAPPTDTSKASVDYSGTPLERLREYAQDAGISFAGKSRAMIESALNEQGYVPKVEPVEITEEEVPRYE